MRPDTYSGARGLPLVLLSALTLLAAGCGGDAAKPTAKGEKAGILAVIGDTPYGAEQVARFPEDVASINADRGVERVIHLGDIQEGPSRCEDRYLARIRRDFDAFEAPLVYTPGDNEWADCHKPNKGGEVPTERLARLRSIFFDRPGRTLGKRAGRVEAQAPPYVENVRFTQARTVFVTLDVPGSNNGLEPWSGAATAGAKQLKTSRSRLRANLDWLDQAFDAARAQRAVAVVVAMQADMWPPPGIPIETSGYDPIVARLARRARAFRRPVLVLNGDSHRFRFDFPLARGSPIHNVTTEAGNVRRVVVQGAASSPHEWLRLHVDPGKPDVFSWDRVVLRR